MFFHMLAAAASIALVQAPCPELETLTCDQVDGGIVISDNPELAGRYAEAIRLAAERFERFFGAPAPLAAVAASDSGGLPDRLALKEAGFPSTLVWLTPEGKQAQRLEAVRRQISAARPDLPAAAVEAMAARAFESAGAPALSAGQDLGAVAHELCHFHLTEAFGLHRAEGSGGGHYGGTAPDWMDEAAAVMCENDAVAGPREAALVRLAASSGLAPLADFLTMDHPLNSTVQALRESGRVGEGVNVMSSDELAAIRGQGAMNPVDFYTQALGFARFLIETTGEETILGHIASAFSIGDDFETFLAMSGVNYGLPSSVERLSADWEAWLARMDASTIE